MSKETECRCKELIEEAERSLEINVDSKYLTAGSYQTARAVAISQCPVHGYKSKEVT